MGSSGHPRDLRKTIAPIPPTMAVAIAPRMIPVRNSRLFFTSLFMSRLNLSDICPAGRCVSLSIIPGVYVQLLCVIVRDIYVSLRIGGNRDIIGVL